MSKLRSRKLLQCRESTVVFVLRIFYATDHLIKEVPGTSNPENLLRPEGAKSSVCMVSKGTTRAVLQLADHPEGGVLATGTRGKKKFTKT